MIIAALPVILLALSLAGWGPALAADASEQRVKAAEDAFSKFKEAHGGGWKLDLDKRSGIPAALYGSEYEKLPGGPKEVAAGFLDRHGELFLLKKDRRDLRAAKVLKGAGTNHVKFQQYYKGLKVFLSGVDVHMREGGKVHFVRSRYKLLGDIGTEPAVTLENAMKSAMEDIGAKVALRGDTQSELVIYPANGGSHLAWQLLIPTSKPLGTWLVIVDARQGQVLFKKDILRH